MTSSATIQSPARLTALGVPDHLPERRTEPQPERGVTWHPDWSHPGHTVRGAEHLAVLVSSLPLHEFGGVCIAGDDSAQWAQTKRMEQGWIVEVRDASTGEWPHRVYRGTAGSYLRAVLPEVHCAEEHFTPYAAALVMWSWLRGSLPDGCSSEPPVD